MKLAVAGAALLVIAGGGAFYFASTKAKRAGPATAEPGVTVTITGRTCEPNDLVVPAGRNTFRIVNKSDRAVEWEILDGVMVVEERENIAPGMSQLLTAKLAPGDYAITCGLLSNPRGMLHVTPSAAAAAEATAKPWPTAFVGPLAEYKVFLALESAALVEATGTFSEAVKSGDIGRAKALYASTRTAYKRMEPVVERYADLDTAIDARADYFEQREDDPGFTGFHRIEYGLFARNSAQGLTSVIDKLQADVTALRQRVRELQLPPDALALGAERVIARIAEQKSAGSENRYSHTDLSDFQANLEGARKIVNLLRPLAAPADPDLAARVDARFEEATAAIVRFRGPEGFVAYDQLGADARAELIQRMRALAAEIAKLNGALGLS
jgi:iron uptake system component EfeO